MEAGLYGNGPIGAQLRIEDKGQVETEKERGGEAVRRRRYCL